MNVVHNFSLCTHSICMFFTDLQAFLSMTTWEIHIVSVSETQCYENLIIICRVVCSPGPVMDPSPGISTTIVTETSGYCKRLLQALHVCAVTRVAMYAARH